ncbi:MAG: PQQ-binding-like beta-propeller repeat protein [Verrucomicrobia bacterium]|nr:PQQ-binding-like beta-propeller repeat protein [Verrucomicrobiota bacterium]
MKTDAPKLFPIPHRLGSVRWVLIRELLVAAALVTLSSTHAAVTEAWVARYNNVVSNANGMSSKIVRDAAGDIIVTGSANDGVRGQDMLTIKYSGADGSVHWQRRYNGPANGNDVVQALAVDSQGNVVVAGYSFAGMDPNGYLIFLYDYYIAKYASTDGALLWEKRYHDPDSNYAGVSVIMLLMDGSDNVVIAGSRHTAKFAAADGERLWLQPYPGVTVAAALDRGGNVVVAGYSFSSSTYEDIYTVKYAAADGALLWDRRYNGTNWEYSVDYASALAVDSRGDVVVTGYNGNTRSGDWYAAKYAAADGALLWEQQGGGVTTSLAVDSRGNVVMTGYTTTGFVAWGWPVFTEYYTAKYAAANGALLWATASPYWQAANFDQNDNVIADSGNRYANYAAASGALLAEGEFPFPVDTARVWDGSGNVVVTGGNFETAKYVAATGVLLWEQQFKGPINLADIAQAVAVDGSGNVVVAGSSQSETSMDYYTAKYAAANGALLWERRYNGPAHQDDVPVAVAVDGSGNVVVTGSSYSDYYTAKYAGADGEVLWEKRYDGPMHGDDRPIAMAVDEIGNVVVTGSSYSTLGYEIYTAKYAAADGTLLWERRHPGSPAAVGVDRSGNVVVASSLQMVKYAAADGSVIWKFAPLFNVFVQAMALDSQGNVILTGSHATAYNEGEYYTAKYAAADGALLWEKRYHNPGSYGQHQARSVAVDAIGNVVVTGFSPNGSDDSNVCYTAKYAAADGHLLWEKRSPLGEPTVVVDGRGNVVLAGASYNGTNDDYYTAKYSAADGALLWKKSYNGPANGQDRVGLSHPIAIGPNGIIAVTGYSSAVSDPLIIFGGTSAYDFATVVYRETEPPVAIATVSPRFAVSSNGTNATVILNGSRSSDPDGDPLQYTWSEAGNFLASGVVAVTVLPVGAHSIQLVVGDGTLSATNAIVVDVITTAQAVERLITQVEATVKRPRSLRVTLRAAVNGVHRGKPVLAIHLLRAFQHQVGAQVARHDPELAQTLIQAARDIIDALGGGNTHPPGGLHCRFTCLTCQPNGRMRMQFSAEVGGTHIIEASTNLVNWEMIGVAAPMPDSRFEFEDAQSGNFSSRFYRVVHP